jgi:hypothetical protein
MVGADNRLVVAEDLSDDDLDRLKARFEKLAKQPARRRRSGTAATNSRVRG